MRFSEHRRGVAAGILLGVIAATTVAGAVLLAAQERSRLRLVAEFQAFQLGSELLRTLDAGSLDSLDEAEGLVGFGVYNARGEATTRFGDAPASVRPQAALKKAKFEGGVVSFLRAVGGNPQRLRPGRRQSDEDAFGAPLPAPIPEGAGPEMMGPGMSGMPGMGGARFAQRFLYVAYDATSLGAGERWIYAGSALVILAVAAATAILASLARSLGDYREREARNRELVALGEAARTLAHEIKNPLGVVKIQCALLRKKVDGDSLHGVKVIEEETDRLALLASRVKSFLSADAGEIGPIDVGELLASFASRYGDALRVVGLDPLRRLTVKADRLRIEQILDNLISNARESGPDGAAAEVPELSVEAHRGRILLRVADRGRGIAPEAADRVFDLFYTTKTSGAGLGLAIAKRYAEASGGTLAHEARSGGGTIFTLDLPGAST
jgi:two-component system sensor histidine kinase HydH